VGLVLLVVALVVGVYGYVRTPAGSRFLLNETKKRLLSTANLKLEYQEGEIDPFSRVHFKNLTLTRGSGAERVEVQIPALDANFSLSLFGRRLTVDRLRVDHPNIYFHETIREPSSDEPRTPASTAKSPVEAAEQLRDLVTSPPVKVVIKEATLDGLVADIDRRGPGNELQLKITKLDAKMNLELVPKRFTTSGEVNWAPGSHLSQITIEKDKRIEIAADPAGTAKWAVSTGPESNHWAYAVRPSDVHFTLGALHFRQKSEAGEQRLDCPRVSLDTALEMSAHTDGPFQAPGARIDKLAMTGGLKMGAGEVATANAKSTTLLKFQDSVVDAKAEASPDVTFSMTKHTRGITSPTLLVRPISAVSSLSGILTSDLTTFTLTLAGAINESNIFNATFNANSRPTAKANGILAANLNADLAKSLKAPAIKTLGLWLMKGSFEASSTDSIRNLADFDRQTLDQGRANLKLGLDQTNQKGATLKAKPILVDANFAGNTGKPTFAATVKSEALETPSATLNKIDIAFDGKKEGEGWLGKMRAQFPDVKAAAIKKSIAAQGDADVNWNPAREHVALKGNLNLQNESVAAFEATADLKANPAKVTATFSGNVRPSLDDLLASDVVKKYGQWALKSDLKLEAPQPFSPKQWRGVGNVVFTQSNTGKDTTLLVTSPIQIDHRIDFTNQQSAVIVEAVAPLIEKPKVVRMKDTRFQFALTSPDLSAGKEFDATMTVKQGEVIPDPGIAKGLPAMAGLTASAKATLRDADRFTLDSFSADFNRSMLKASADGTGRWTRKDFQFRGEIKGEIPKGFPEVAGQTVRGSLIFPWTMSLLRGRDASFEGYAGLSNVAWSKDTTKLRGLSGRVPISEKLIIDGTKVKFASLITQNPFERVDYERLRPLIQGAEQVRIEEISQEDKKYGPFVGFFSMRQNMIFAHQFDFRLGSRGAMNGEMYFDVYPANLTLGLLARITNVNLLEVLPKRMLVNVPKGDKNLSGRSGIVINLNRSAVDGRVDITEIGASQLITLINVLDPKYEDDRMNLARSALGVGYPTFVQMAFDNGYMDLGMELSVLGISQRFDVREIPISSLVSSATEDIVKKTQEGPLE
jgi:hypothetical protein